MNNFVPGAYVFVLRLLLEQRSHTALVRGFRKPKGLGRSSSLMRCRRVIEVCYGSNSQLVPGERFVAIAQFGAFRCFSKLALLLFEGGVRDR
jgi:hypothetical protein